MAPDPVDDAAVEADELILEGYEREAILVRRCDDLTTELAEARASLERAEEYGAWALAEVQRECDEAVARAERAEAENTAWRRGECTCRDDHASWCPIYRAERAEAEAELERLKGVIDRDQAEHERIVTAMHERAERAEAERDEWRHRAKDTERFLARANAAEAELRKAREALTEIRDQDWVENTLDPQWAARIAALALEASDAGS